MLDLKKYKKIWAIDFEFISKDGNNPRVICLVALDILSGEKIRMWEDELYSSKPPFEIGEGSLFIAYYASAEIGCFIELDWDIPTDIIDLFTEFRVYTNGQIGRSNSNSLLSALKYFEIPTLGEFYKDEMRDLILSGGPWSLEEKQDIFEYCESDVVSLRLLFPKLADRFTSHSLLRGRYMSAVAHMENQGIPIDIPMYNKITDNWGKIKEELIQRLDTEKLYEGTTFKSKRFEEWLASKGYSWPRTDKGNISLAEDTFREMSIVYPETRKIHELRHSLSKLKLQNLMVGEDGRNRCMLSPFRSITGRNQPSTTKFIFGPSSWTRALIKPEEGKAIAYIDWSQQEFGIAASLSQDPKMLKAYTSGDPYLEFAKLAKAVPEDATKEEYSKERDIYKQCILATQYGMGAKSLSFRINKSEVEAQKLLDMHRGVFSTYWNWVESAGDFAQINGYIETVFAWPLYVHAGTKPKTIQNFPMQANGSEMLRLATCLAVEKGVSVCAPIHDALLIESEITCLDENIQLAQDCMREASRIVLDGFELGSDVKIVKYPERYIDERGLLMWKTVCEIVGVNG